MTETKGKYGSEKTKGNSFYYVVKDDGKSFVSYRHATFHSAYAEAVRLAKQEKCSFFVMATIARITTKVVIADVEDVRPDKQTIPCKENADTWKQETESILKEYGFEFDSLRGTWSKSF